MLTLSRRAVLRALGIAGVALPLAVRAQARSSDPPAETKTDRMTDYVKTRTVLTLAGAKRVALEAAREAGTRKVQISIAVVDHTGALLYAERMDDTPNNSLDVAIRKAVHAANFRRDTRFHQDLLTGGNNLVLALPDSLPIDGGVRLIVDGALIGAVGISGAPSDVDGQIATAAAKTVA